MQGQAFFNAFEAVDIGIKAMCRCAFEDGEGGQRDQTGQEGLDPFLRKGVAQELDVLWRIKMLKAWVSFSA